MHEKGTNEYASDLGIFLVLNQFLERLFPRGFAMGLSYDSYSSWEAATMALPWGSFRGVM